MRSSNLHNCASLQRQLVPASLSLPHVGPARDLSTLVPASLSLPPVGPARHFAPLVPASLSLPPAGSACDLAPVVPASLSLPHAGPARDLPTLVPASLSLPLLGPARDLAAHLVPASLWLPPADPACDLVPLVPAPLSLPPAGPAAALHPWRQRRSRQRLFGLLGCGLSSACARALGQQPCPRTDQSDAFINPACWVNRRRARRCGLQDFLFGFVSRAHCGARGHHGCRCQPWHD